MTSPWPPFVRVYRFNAALWAARRYGFRLRRGMARRRGAAMRAAGNPCGHKGEDGAICTVCDQALAAYTPDDRYCEPLTPCDWAGMNDHEQRCAIHWRTRKAERIAWGLLPLPAKHDRMAWH